VAMKVLDSWVFMVLASLLCLPGVLGIGDFDEALSPLRHGAACRNRRRYCLNQRYCVEDVNPGICPVLK